MPKPKTIYSLKGIFTEFLEDSETKCFMIPAYQRGYKWTSVGSNSQVALLMSDIHSAFKENRERYYLQFLTLKMNGDVLEVIDGQQRLTTLTILFSVLYHIEKTLSVVNIVSDKLNYQVRDNFVKEFIYENINLILEENSWDDFAKKYPQQNNQDVYFIYSAVIAIYQFLIAKLQPSEYKTFHTYICEKVYLIVNPLEDDVNSERIFINVNKGVKLKDEDLVKGLLITKIPRDNQSRSYRMTEIEINEMRTNLGRQWDDISRWSSHPEIKSFFKISNNESAIEWLILLSFPEIKIVDSNPIFNYLDNCCRTENLLASDIFQKIRNTMFTLNDWFCEPELCNLLGYTLHADNSNGLENIWKELSFLNTKVELLKKLKELVIELLPIDKQNGLKELNYEDSKHELFNLFLMLDVAKFLPIGNRKSVQYDFGVISSEKWSIEHIFPQNIGEIKNLTALAGYDLELIKELIPKNFKDISFEDDEKRTVFKIFFNKLIKAKNECKIEFEELEFLNYILKRNTGDLHKIGNLALLEKGMNSGLTNHFFDEKRKKIVRKVSSGEFVPYHTYDVFSKLVIDTKTSLHFWSKNDITKHEEYIKEQVNHITNYLNSNI